jgi:DNA-binding response OmpR family regulator
VRILLIEDEAPLARMIQLSFQKARYQVVWCARGDDGLARAIEESFDAIVLDLMLPGVDGWSVCRRLRDRRDATPILMLTARDEIEDRVRGLELGADDYLPKPFDLRELNARIGALIRRGALQRRRLVCLGALEIDLTERIARCQGADISLTPREFDLLALLVNQEGSIVSRERILASWGEPEVSPNTVEVHLAALRKKLDAAGAPGLIQTAHRRGYVLRHPPVSPLVGTEGETGP